MVRIATPKGVVAAPVWLGAMQGFYRASFNLMVRSAFAAQHPEVVQRVLQALDTTMHVGQGTTLFFTIPDRR